MRRCDHGGRRCALRGIIAQALLDPVLSFTSGGLVRDRPGPLSAHLAEPVGDLFPSEVRTPFHGWGSEPLSYFRAATSTPAKRISAPPSCPGVGISPKMTTPATSVINGWTKRSTEPTTLGRCGMEALISG